ncbi:MAG: hypothetical protein EHM42_05225, partial [Planctomycetaceae bacterium]
MRCWRGNRSFPSSPKKNRRARPRSRRCRSESTGRGRASLARWPGFQRAIQSTRRGTTSNRWHGWRVCLIGPLVVCVAVSSVLRFVICLILARRNMKMAEITAEAVRALRERTDLPMMECKKALTEAGGDQEKAVQILKEKVKGLKVKVADRMTSEGRVASLAAADGSAAVMVEVQCETAPVAKSEGFLLLCDQLCKQLLNGPGADSVDSLLSQSCPDKPGQTLRELYDDVLGKIRENIVIARIMKLAGPVAAYT